ncbi:PilZ domain-containing protein [Novosphingobium lentum]|uniref:PilZ domain-containing protein n=1 Tax=Novosphingobium lentum TaxID=145287 RepID=UPI000832E264|nr:PilZ domain-containing protein [Novosphingobium lentum]
MTIEHDITSISRRRNDRHLVEMIAHLRHDARTVTVVLKDLTRRGARIDGAARLDVDEAVSLTLPGCRPALAFVAWSDDHSAGLEFAFPLQAECLDSLVAAFAIFTQADRYQHILVAA